jgi:hypothetical protein
MAAAFRAYFSLKDGITGSRAKPRNTYVGWLFPGQQLAGITNKLVHEPGDFSASGLKARIEVVKCPWFEVTVRQASFSPGQRKTNAKRCSFTGINKISASQS